MEAIMYKAYCCCCGKLAGEFFTKEAADLHSGHCHDCQVLKVNKALNFVNPDLGK